MPQRRKYLVILALGVVAAFVSTAVAEYDQVAKLTASDGAPDDRFGFSASISGDYAIFGAYLDDDNGSDSGSAYVAQRVGSSWSQMAKLTASDGAAGDHFGESVAIGGDFAVVGANYHYGAAYRSGAAYVFERTGSSWSQVANLTPSDAVEGGEFGISASIDGDYAVIGAYGDDDNGWLSGSAYVFARSGSSWNQVAKLTASDGAGIDTFGIEVSISNDRIIVGSCYDDDDGKNSGSAYIFDRDGSSWNQTAKLTPLDGAPDNQFGRSVSIRGDYAVISSYGDDDNGSDSGAAYVFQYSGGVWAQVAKLTASDGASNDRFGMAVSTDGDYAVVGAHGDTHEGVRSGSTYVFERNDLTWTEAAKLTPLDAPSEEFFGYSVSTDNNYIVVGAWRDDDLGSFSGSAYVYNIPEPATLSLLTLGGLALAWRRKRGACK